MGGWEEQLTSFSEFEALILALPLGAAFKSFVEEKVLNMASSASPLDFEYFRGKVTLLETSGKLAALSSLKASPFHEIAWSASRMRLTPFTSSFGFRTSLGVGKRSFNLLFFAERSSGLEVIFAPFRQ